MLKTIPRTSYNEEFIDYLVSNVLKPMLLPYKNNQNITQFSKGFNINAQDAFKCLVNNITIDHTSSDYIIKFTDKRYNNGYTYQELNNLFKWGNMSVKGYNIIEESVDLVFNKKIKLLYETYLKGLE